MIGKIEVELFEMIIGVKALLKTERER